MKKILIIKAGRSHPKVRAVAGDYEAWFARALPDGAARCETVSPFLQEPLPSLADFGGIVVTGSPASVRDEAPWMDDVAKACLQALEGGIPVLAVCFGHQLLGEALGGHVGENAKGRELGTREIELTEAGREDPLFHGLPQRFLVQMIHGDELVRPPAAGGVKHLASNTHSTWQAFGWGKLRSVQFHPELSREGMDALIDALGAEAPSLDTQHGEAILHNWDRFFVRAS